MFSRVSLYSSCVIIEDRDKSVTQLHSVKYFNPTIMGPVETQDPRRIRNRRISEVIYLPRPTSAKVEAGSLRFVWRKAGGYSPDGKLLHRFLKLGSEVEISRFAARYGPLNHRQPECVEDWRCWINVANSIIGSSERLTRGSVGSIMDWRILHTWIKEDPIKRTPNEELPERDMSVWRGLVARSVRSWIDSFGGAGLGVDWSGKLPRIKPSPPQTLGL